MDQIILKRLNRAKLFSGMLFLVATGFFFNSCLDARLKEPAESFEGYGDIYVQKKKVNGETLYAPYYYLRGNTSMNSASVETPDGGTIELSAFEYMDTYLKEPDEEAFTTSMIELGTYYFSGTYGTSNETFELDDSFYAHIIDFPKIDSVGYDPVDYHFYVFWEPVSDARIYTIKLLDETGNVVFIGRPLTALINSFVIGLDTDGWITTPYKGDVFMLQLHAFSLDEDADNTNWFYNIECDCFSETQVTWGG